MVVHDEARLILRSGRASVDMRRFARHGRVDSPSAGKTPKLTATTTAISPKGVRAASARGAEEDPASRESAAESRGVGGCALRLARTAAAGARLREIWTRQHGPCYMSFL